MCVWGGGGGGGADKCEQVCGKNVGDGVVGGGEDHFALRPQKRGCLLGTGQGERVKTRPQIQPESEFCPKNDQRDCGLPPEQWKC